MNSVLVEYLLSSPDIQSTSKDYIVYTSIENMHFSLIIQAIQPEYITFGMGL